MYTKDQRQEIIDRICRIIADTGKSLRQICEDDSLPHRDTINDWLNANKDFADQYARAKEEGYDYEFEQMEKDILNTPEDKDSILKARLLWDHRRWALSKKFPKKFGDKTHLEHSGDSQAPIVIFEPASKRPKK